MRTAAFLACLALCPHWALAQSAPTPEQSSAKLADTFRELTSMSPGRAIQESIGTYQQMVKERQLRDLTRPIDEKPRRTGAAHFNFGMSSSMDPVYRDSLRFNTDAVDVDVLRASSRITLGGGAAYEATRDHNVIVAGGMKGYGFLKLRLGGPKDEREGRIIVPPAATFTETEVGVNKVRVRTADIDQAIKNLKP